MPKDTLPEAIQREIREGATPIGEIVAGKNVSVLVRAPHLHRQPFLSICATLGTETKSGKVQVYLYAVGSEKQIVPREAVFTRESAWCRGEPIASVCHARTHLWGSVYHKRREYTCIYPVITDGEKKEGIAELTEKQVIADFLRDPRSFQEVEPEGALRKEVRLVAHRGSLFCIRAEVLLHKDWNEQYTGGYLMISEGNLQEEPLENFAMEQCFVATFLQRKALYFAMREAPDIFFIDRDFKQGTRRIKDRTYYLVHGGKIYEIRQCWENQVSAYLRGNLPLEELFRYAFVVNSADE